jgi:hypothetical protein
MFAGGAAPDAAILVEPWQERIAKKAGYPEECAIVLMIMRF